MTTLQTTDYARALAAEIAASAEELKKYSPTERVVLLYFNGMPEEDIGPIAQQAVDELNARLGEKRNSKTRQVCLAQPWLAASATRQECESIAGTVKDAMPVIVVRDTCKGEPAWFKDCPRTHYADRQTDIKHHYVIDVAALNASVSRTATAKTGN
jgi:hypothetical protein